MAETGIPEPVLLADPEGTEVLIRFLRYRDEHQQRRSLLDRLKAATGRQ